MEIQKAPLEVTTLLAELTEKPVVVGYFVRDILPTLADSEPV